MIDDLEPQFKELLTRAEKGINGLVKQESMLQTKVSFVHIPSSANLQLVAG